MVLYIAGKQKKTGRCQTAIAEALILKQRVTLLVKLTSAALMRSLSEFAAFHSGGRRWGSNFETCNLSTHANMCGPDSFSLRWILYNFRVRSSELLWIYSPLCLTSNLLLETWTKRCIRLERLSLRLDGDGIEFRTATVTKTSMRRYG